MVLQVRKVLFPTDFSEVSLCALPYATELVRQFGATLHCLHVIDDTGQYWMGAGENAVPLVVSREELGKSAQEQMVGFCERHLGKLSVPVVSEVAWGRPFVEIVRYAKREQIDMIVIATHGHGGLASVLLGSVTEKVVRKAPCPVLTVRHPEHEFEMP